MLPPSQPAAGSSSRLIGLDLLRLIAVVMVLGRHMEPLPEDWASPLAPVFQAWMNGGGLGVDLFFVLSGFLVSGLLFAEFKKRGELSIKRFYVRRAWKIYPAFYALFGFTYLYHLVTTGARMSDRQALAEVFFVQSYIRSYWNHTWTLAVEEHFYLLLPLLLTLLVRRNPRAANPFRAIPYLVAGSCVLFLAIRFANFSLRTVYSYNKFVFSTHLRLDELFFGVGIAYAWHFHGEAFRRVLTPWRYALVAAGAATLTSFLWLPVPVTSLYIHTLGFTQFYLGSAALMVGVLLCQIPTNRVTSALAGLGTYSYSVYLWHMALMYWAIPRLQGSWSWESRTALYFFGAFAVGVAMAKIVETPMLRLRDRLYPSRIESAVVAVSETPTDSARRAA